MADIKAPLKSKNALDARDEDDLHQLIDELAECLHIKKEPTSAYNSKVRELVSVAKVKKDFLSHVNSTQNEKSPKKLLWEKLVEKVSVTTSAQKGDGDLFVPIAKSYSLKPFTSSYPSTITFSGGSLEEEQVGKFWDFDSLSDDENPLYRFSLTAELLKSTTQAVDTWLEKIGKCDQSIATIRLQPELHLKPEPHRITSNIFQSELEMIGIYTFVFHHEFTLTFEPRYTDRDVLKLKIDLSKNTTLSKIPFGDIFTALVKHSVLIIGKPLIKTIWA